MKSATFTDPSLENEFQINGYVHLKGFITPEQVEELMFLFKSHYDYAGQPIALWNSLCDIDHKVSATLSDRILNVVKPNIQSTFKNYKCPAATFLVKNATEKSSIYVHRDFSVHEEDKFSYRNIWMPIVDTTPENGTLYVVKGSHRFFTYPLPHFTPWPYKNHEKLLMDHCEIIYAKAGDLIVYDDKVLHGSFDNKTTLARPVVHFGLLHEDAQLCYFYHNLESDEVTVYEVPYTFFFESAWGNQDHRFKIVKKFKFDPPIYTDNEIVKGLSSYIGAV